MASIILALLYSNSIDKENFKFDKPWDRVYNHGAPLLLYSGNFLTSPISAVGHLINKNDLLRSVALKWDIETGKPLSMKVMKCVYDIINEY